MFSIVVANQWSAGVKKKRFKPTLVWLVAGNAWVHVAAEEMMSGKDKSGVC